ncbi:hypothetical protein WMY93_026975 [Mugilogobius chulae]|uniref:Gypsy retrotransposon integrase-like protein 1 n=1 Tax=Mugilogobius chulae TaxID=88201 RepID=A0AAW0MVZ2_9GOBI
MMPWFMGAAWIPKFCGEQAKFGEWRAQVEAMLRAQGLSQQQQADFVLGALEGDAKRELMLVRASDKDTSVKVLDLLQTLYAKPATKAQSRMNFFNCKQRTDESINAFILRLREVFSRWQERDQDGTEDSDDLLLDQLMVGLRKGQVKQELSRQMRRRDDMAFEAACKEARALELEFQEDDEALVAHRVTTYPPPKPAAVNAEQIKDQIHSELKTELLGEIKKEIKEQITSLSAAIVEDIRTQLFNRDQSPARPPQFRQQRPNTPSYRWDEQAEGQAAGAVVTEPTSQASLPVEHQSTATTVNDSKAALVGSQVTMMSQSLFRRCMGGIHVTNADEVPWLTLRAANGLQIPYVGYVTVNCEGNHPGLAAFKTTLSSAEGKAWSRAFMECQKVVLGGPRPAFEGAAKLPRQPPVIIPPHTEMVLWMQEDQELVLNSIEPDVIEVAVRRVVGAVGTEDDVHPVISLQGDGLTEDQQTKMTTLLQRWKSVFSRHDEDFGRTGVVKHQIPTGMAPPSRERYRPVPPSLYPELRSLLKNMLESGVVRESSSPWAAPIVLVRKKDGSWRFCVDYRRLNAVTHKDAYPLPRIEESLTGLKAAKWYSTLDLASGYWQVEVEPADQEKTAFTTPFGLYEFERMPFGLCNAPATFQRLMQRCLGNMVNDFLLIYLDDVVVFSADFDSHLAHLEEVFRKLSDHGLKLQPRKCCLFQKSVTYLGHVISEAGVATDPAKTAAVKEWPVPKTVKQVKSFLGFAGYYRRFISGFSKIALPLNALTHGTAHEKTAPVTWSSDCQQAFDQLKKALINAPVLAYADFSLPFRLYTDASFEGLGAVLAQVQDGKERVIAYASRSLQPAERNDQNYSSFKLELLALKWAVTDKFKDYLYGAEFVVFTDNNPLVHLDTARLGAVEQRWVAQLANFNYTLKYRPGTQNRNADALSRLPEEEVGPAQAFQVTIEGEPSWDKRQAADPDLRRIKQLKDQGQGRPEVCGIMSSYLKTLLRDWDRIDVNGGVLQRRWQELGTETIIQQILVPKQEAMMVWKTYHEKMGHPSRDRTVTTLKQRCYWPGMDKDCEEWGKACLHCLYNKARPDGRAPLVPIETSYPFEIVGIDYLSLGRPGDRYPYILVMTDLFSKYAIAVPARDQLADTTVKALYRHLILTFGCPERILSDRGAAFELALVNNPISPSRHARLPVDWSIEFAPAVRTESLEGWTQHHQQALKQAYQLTNRRAQQRQSQDQARYNHKARLAPLLPGERVLIRNFRRRARGKLSPRWGPELYVVVEQLRGKFPVYIVRPEGKTGPTRTHHHNNLRPCPVNVFQEEVPTERSEHVEEVPTARPEDLPPPHLVATTTDRCPNDLPTRANPTYSTWPF